MRDNVENSSIDPHDSFSFYFMATYVNTRTILEKVFEKRIMASFKDDSPAPDDYNSISDFAKDSAKKVVSDDAFAVQCVKSELEMIDEILTMAKSLADSLFQQKITLTANKAADVATYNVPLVVNTAVVGALGPGTGVGTAITSPLATAITNIYTALETFYDYQKTTINSLVNACKCKLCALGLSESDFLMSINEVTLALALV